MNFLKKHSFVLLIAASFFFVTGMTGCSSEGTAEKTGKKIDESVESVKKSVTGLGDKIAEQGSAEKVGEKIDKSVEAAKETAEEIGDKITGTGPVEKAGEKIDETIEKVREAVESKK